MIAANRAQRVSAGMLALGVHGLFLLALMFGVSWRTLPELPVYADLWDALPATSEPPSIVPAPSEAPLPPPPRPEPVPPPRPEPVPPPRPEPVPVPKPPAPAKPDISPSAKPEAKPATPKPPQADPDQERARQALEQRQREAELAAAEARRQALEQARLELERELAQQAQSDIARELDALRRVQQVQAQSARGRLILEHRDRIRDQIHQHLRPCPQVPANREVVFSVQLLPSGDLKRLDLTQKSGSDACDGDVERAIRKAFPLPLPQDREAARAFTREPVELRLRPNETPAGEGRG